jgi:hypothetical protein
MFEDAPDAGETEEPPSRAKRIFVRAKIAVALIAPVVGLVALFLIARTSGSADADRVANLQTATPVATASHSPSLKFFNPWSDLFPIECPTPGPEDPALPTPPAPSPDVCPRDVEINFNNQWLGG